MKFILTSGHGTEPRGASRLCQRASRPTNRDQVEDRISELKYGNRLLQDRKSATRINKLAELVGALADLVGPEDLPDALRQEVDKAKRYKVVRLIPVDMQDPGVESAPPAQHPLDGKDGHGDFSPRTVAHRFDVGHTLARRVLARELPSGGSTGQVPSTWTADGKVVTPRLDDRSSGRASSAA